MVQDNKKIVSSVQSAAAHGVPRLLPHLSRVRKLSKSHHQHLKNNTKPTKAKSSNVIHVKIRPPASTVSGDITENLFSFSSILTTRYDRTQANQSFIFQNSSSQSQNDMRAVNVIEPNQSYIFQNSSSSSQNRMADANTSVPIQHDQPWLKTNQNFRNSNNLKSNSESRIISSTNITSEISMNHGQNPKRLPTEKKYIFRQPHVSPSQNTNNIQSFQVPNSKNIEEVTDVRWNKINPGKKYFTSLGEIENISTKKNRLSHKPSRLCVFLSVLAVILIGAAITGTVAGIIVTQKKTTTTPTIATTTTGTTTTVTTQTTTTTTSTTTETTTTTPTTTETTTATSTTIETTTTTSTTTTATTPRPLLCPSSAWNPNATTVAGSANGVGGSSYSQLSTSYYVTVDSAFNVYVSDYGNYRVMKWPPNTTNGTKVGPQLGSGSGPNTSHMNTATAIRFDVTQSNLYISDTFNCRILKWNIASNNITVAAGGTGCGSGLNQFSWCDGLYSDRFGNLYVSDYLNDRVLKFPPNSNSSTNGTIVAGTGTASSYLNALNTPRGIYVDESDNDALYIADFNNHRVMKWLPNAKNGTIVAGGNGFGTLYTQLASPSDVFVDFFGTVYVSERDNERITKWLKGAKNGSLVAGTGIAGNTRAQLNNPTGITFDTNGNLYAADISNNRVQKFMIINDTSC